MATTKPKHYFVNDDDFQIVASVVESKKGHTRFETEKDAKTYASKSRKEALSDYCKNFSLKPLTMGSAKNVIDKRDLLAFQGVKDLARSNTMMVTYLTDYTMDESVRKIISGLGFSMTDRYTGSCSVSELDMNNLLLANDGTERFVTNKQTVTDSDGYAIYNDSVSTRMSCIYFVGDEMVPVSMSVRVHGVKKSDVARLLPERMMTDILMNEAMNTMLTDKNLH